MGDVAPAPRRRGSAADAAPPARARAFSRAAMEPFVASWQTVTGLGWLAGRITRTFGGYYADAAMTRLAGRRRAAGLGVPRAGQP
jgi:hypothetical protein